MTSNNLISSSIFNVRQMIVVSKAITYLVTVFRVCTSDPKQRYILLLLALPSLRFMGNGLFDQAISVFWTLAKVKDSLTQPCVGSILFRVFSFNITRRRS